MIRLTLGLAEGDGITEAKMLELTRLDAGPKSRLIGLYEIEDLTGLEYATNLTTLLLGSNSIRDLTPIAGLTKLTRFEIFANRVVFITPLAGLTNLEKLNLAINQISNITPLKNLTNLTELLLHVNEIRDVTPLKGLTNLTELTLIGNRITDLTPLAGLTAEIDIVGSSRSAPAMKGKGIRHVFNKASLKMLNKKSLQRILHRLTIESDGSILYQQNIAIVKSVLKSKSPPKTMLLANYPNPFNPETWIPYHLAIASSVDITIYNMQGTTVRHLDLGHQEAGYHTNRSQAAYWDGKNDLGIRVASGPYFYQLNADNVSPMRKMVVLK